MSLLILWALFIGALLSFPLLSLRGDADPTGDFCSLGRQMSGFPRTCQNVLFSSPKVEHLVAREDGIPHIAGGCIPYSTGYGNYGSSNTCTMLRPFCVSNSFQTPPDSANYVRTEPIPSTVPNLSNAAFFPTESGVDLTSGNWQSYNSTNYREMEAPTGDRKRQSDIEDVRWMDTGIRRYYYSSWTKTSRGILSSSMVAWIPAWKGVLFGGAFFPPVNATSLLITYDQATSTWTNQTTLVWETSEGGLVHIKTATDEVLVQFGGRYKSVVRDFYSIKIYSIKESKWYTQSIPVGDPVPPPRFAFCSALKSASDGSSHQIYILGGLEARTKLAGESLTARTIWVLSIPSFEWAQLPYTSKTTAADPGGRISPKCEAIGEHYIFYYGGSDPMSCFDNIICNKGANSEFLFDINTLTWTDKFTPNEGRYEIPARVIKLIGGDKNGGSTKTCPKDGWDYEGLETIMKLRATTATRSPSPGSASRPHSAKTKVGAIVGGAVGGVVAVALGFLGAEALRRLSQRGILRLFSHLKWKSTSARALEKGGGPAELMDDNIASRGGVCAVELPSGEVAIEMETGP